ncbi:GSCOCG00012150001-RA-CDS, partial [Cotesia congregata]
MCSPKPWTEILSTALLGLRTSFKEDIQATPADLLYGTCLRVPGEFFTSAEMPSEPQIFVEKHREYMRGLHPTTTAHHNKARIFILRNLDTCSHVFVRCDKVKAPLEAPYIGPYKVLNRISDRVYTLDIDGEEKNISIERLKPAYIAKNDESHPVTDGASTPAPTQSHRNHITGVEPWTDHKRLTNEESPSNFPRKLTRGGVVVAARLARSRHSDGSCNQTCLDGTHGQQRNYLSNSSAKT